MRIALSGYYGFDNAGDEALLSAITSSIKRIEPEAEFVVFSGSPGKTSYLHGIRAVYYMNPLELIKELLHSDLLISGGGSIFQDVTSGRSLAYYISVVALAKILRKPVIFYAQGVGPINRRLSKFLMRLVANKVDIITLRDEESAHLLKSLGVNRPPFHITADPVFSLQPDDKDRQITKHLLATTGKADKPAIGVSVRKWPALDGYQKELARVLDDLTQKGYQIVFIPLAYPEDLTESQRVAALMKNKPEIIEQNLTSKEHLALIAQMRLIVGMRLHSLIFAANCGVPFAGISYDPKVKAFLKKFNLPPLVLKYDEMKAQVESLLEDTDAQDKIRVQADELRRQSEENAHLALSLIES